GWFPLVIAASIFTLLMTWRKGREIVSRNRVAEEGPLQDFIDSLAEHRFPVRRVPGVGVFLNATQQTTPLALRANVEHNHVMHERVIILTIEVAQVPHVAEAQRLTVDDLGHGDDGISGLIASYGFQDTPNVPALMRLAIRRRLLEGTIDVEQVRYFLSQI